MPGPGKKIQNFSRKMGGVHMLANGRLKLSMPVIEWTMQPGKVAGMVTVIVKPS